MGIIEVREDGIYYVMSDPYQNGRMIFQSRLIITKEAFIEAYNKYIKEEAQNEQIQSEVCDRDSVSSRE